MRKIQSVGEVRQLCTAKDVRVVKTCSEKITVQIRTALVLERMGSLYYIGCMEPGTACVDRVLHASTDTSATGVTLRAAPWLIKQRLQYLAGALPYTTPLAKHMLYRALASTPELSILSELEGHEHSPLTDELPWGLTAEAQVAIRRIHTNV